MGGIAYQRILMQVLNDAHILELLPDWLLMP